MAEAITTLSDVAELAGVSISTASRALNGLKVSGDNAARVRRAADQLGYVANQGARSLRSVRTMTMGVIFNQLTNPLSLELLDALTSGVEQRGYNLFISTARGDEARYDILVHRFLERRVDALFCVNASGEGAALARFKAAGIPVAALFHASGGYAGLPRIGPTTQAAAEAAVDRLVALGHRKVGMIRPPLRRGPVETLLAAVQRAGLSVQTYEPPEGPLDGLRCLRSLMDDADAPTAILGPQASVISLLEAAETLGLRAPRDLSLIAVRDRTQMPPTTRLPLSTIHLRPDQVGRVAADRMCEWLAGEPLRDNVMVDMGVWIERASLAAAPARQES